jgi:hypothetical protein
VRSMLLRGLLAAEMYKIQHLRVEVGDKEMDDSYDSYHEQPNIVRDLPAMESFDLLERNGLPYHRRRMIKDNDWGACPVGNIRIIDA